MLAGRMKIIVMFATKLEVYRKAIKLWLLHRCYNLFKKKFLLGQKNASNLCNQEVRFSQ